MKNNSAFLILVAFIPSVLLGYWVGLQFKIPDYSTQPIPPPLPLASFTPVPTMPHGQRTILIVHPDEMSTASSHPRSIWLLTYFLSTAKLNLIPVYPSISEDAASKNHDILSSYGIINSDGYLAPAPMLVQTLHEHLHDWGSYIILDETAIQNIFTLAGANPPLLPHIPTSGGSSPSLYYGHVQEITRFCHAIRNASNPLDWSQIGQWSEEHFITDLGTEALIADWQALTNPPSNLRCDFPTIIQEHK